MKFLFEDQPHQAAAQDAVADLFDGAIRPAEGVLAGEAPGASGHAGFSVDADCLAENLARVTRREATEPQDELALMDETDLLGNPRAFPNFSVEMETGTGKTYVYISTALRLAETHGLRKFVILVHSVAIRAGVMKTLADAREHFRGKFPNLPYEWSSMGDAGAVSDFADPSASVRFLVASVQLLDKPDTNSLYAFPEQPRIWGDALSGAEQVAATRPVVIIDEPQNMASPLRRRVIATLNPIFALRYSATHREQFNLVHRLGARKAAEAGLVKRVSVKGVVAGGGAGAPYVRIVSVSAKKRILFAELIADVAVRDGVERGTIVARAGDDLFELTGGVSGYEGYSIEEIVRKPDAVIFGNGVRLAAGEELGVDCEAVWRDQIRQTVRAHFRAVKGMATSGRKAKVLSLFFVERVADYVGQNAWIPAAFDSIYAEESRRAGESAETDPAERRIAYFPSTKTGILKDSKGGNKSDAEMEDRAYREIIEQKELLLDPDNPRAFIFSHSALREGWDNPNVFQICFLRHSKSETERRQQIGRGLRLPVDSSGRRIMDPTVNRLTLVVDESFSEFRKGLDAEYEGAGGARGDRPDVENADDVVEIRRRPSVFESPEFSELWRRIRYRAVYRVSVERESLVSALESSEHLDELLYVGGKGNVIQSADLEFDDDGRVATRDSDVGEAAGERPTATRRVVPNPVRLVEDRLMHGKFPLMLTRRTIAELIAAVPEKMRVRALDDPESWSRVFAKAVRVATIESMVSGISYEPMDEDSWWDANVVFLEVERKNAPVAVPGKTPPTSGVAEVSADGAGLHDHVEYDSLVELAFARKLDAERDRVKLFVKLPRRFRVGTPVGEYSPDWAIVVEEGGKEMLYLVRETKSTLNLDDLEWDEAMRIRFAARHFAAAPLGSVDFVHTTDKAGLRIGETEA